MRLLAALLVLGALGCAGKKSQTQLPPSLPAGIVAVQPNPGHLVGPPFPPPSGPTKLTASALNASSVAGVGSTVQLALQVLDENGGPVQGAYCSFTCPSGGVYGLGTATTGPDGRVSVSAIPATSGAHQVLAQAVTAQAISNQVTFTVAGGP